MNSYFYLLFCVFVAEFVAEFVADLWQDFGNKKDTPLGVSTGLYSEIIYTMLLVFLL